MIFVRGGVWHFFLIVFFAIGCSSQPREDETIAKVNGKKISVHDYLVLFETLKPKELSLSGKERLEVKNLVIKSLVRRAVVLTEAEKRGIKLSDKEVQDGIKRFQEGYNTEGSFQEILLDQMVDANEWKEQIRQNLLIEKIFQTTEPKLPAPSLQEALEYYQQNPEEFHTNAEATALQIVVSTKKQAEDLRKRVLAQPSLFASIAKESSIGPEAQVDAKIEIEKDMLPEPLDNALFSSKIGEISPVIESPYGFHILKVLKRTPALNRDFETVKDEILARLTEENRRVWLLRFEEKLIRAANIEYNRKLVAKL